VAGRRSSVNSAPSDRQQRLLDDRRDLQLLLDLRSFERLAVQPGVFSDPNLLPAASVVIGAVDVAQHAWFAAQGGTPCTVMAGETLCTVISK
jgi:hypothetical protein